MRAEGRRRGRQVGDERVDGRREEQAIHDEEREAGEHGQAQVSARVDQASKGGGRGREVGESGEPSCLRTSCTTTTTAAAAGGGSIDVVERRAGQCYERRVRPLKG